MPIGALALVALASSSCAPQPPARVASPSASATAAPSTQAAPPAPASPSPPTPVAGASAPPATAPAEPSSGPPLRAAEVGVTFDITPARARLEIGGVPQQRLHDDLPYMKYLPLGTHTIRIVDETREFDPIDREVVITRTTTRLAFDMAKMMASLEVLPAAEVRHFRLALDDRQLQGQGPHRISVGHHTLAYHPVAQSHCYAAGPERRVAVDIERGGEQKQLSLAWPKVDSFIWIKPQYRSGHRSEDAVDAIVRIDGVVVAPTEQNGTTYKVPCEAQRIVVSKAGYSDAVLDLNQQNIQRHVREGAVWPAPLIEDRLRGVHVDCHEVTVREYDEYLNATNQAAVASLQPAGLSPYSHTWYPQTRTEHLDYPVNAVSYGAARGFCEWRAREKGRAAGRGRLASASDLRLAAGTAEGVFRYPWGEKPSPSCALIQMNDPPGHDGCRTSHGAPTKVCEKSRGKGRFGHCDLLGNVAEWVSDGDRTVFGGGFRTSAGSGRLDMRAAPAAVDVALSDNVGFRCAWRIETDQICDCREGRVDHATH